MIKVYQKRWFDIKFNEFYQLDSKKIVDRNFYKHYYDVFYQTYGSWENLPPEYLSGRRKVAKHLAKTLLMRNMQTALTLGCGNGIIEKELLTHVPHINIFAYEPDETNLKWLKQLSNVTLCFGNFPECLPAEQKYDLVYLCDVDPIFSDAEYVSLLKQIKQVTSAPILLTDVIKPLPSILAHVKYWTKLAFAKMGLYKLGQLQGYSRYFREHQAIFARAGYEVVKKGDFNQDLMWMEIAPVGNKNS